jgi:tetrahydromethanopterin S-methyltransferase subunit G
MKKQDSTRGLKTIKEFPMYSIDVYGNVFSRYRNIFLTPGLSSNGYLSVCLTKNKKQKTHEIHTLVYDTWFDVSRRERKGLVVDHINFNKIDNRLENLQLITQKDNVNRSIVEKKRKKIERQAGIVKFIDRFLLDHSVKLDDLFF